MYESELSDAKDLLGRARKEKGDAERRALDAEERLKRLEGDLGGKNRVLSEENVRVQVRPRP